MTLPPPPELGRAPTEPSEVAAPSPYAAGPYAPAPYGQGPYAPVPARLGEESTLPLVPVDYHQLLRGPRRRWWRPLLSLLLVVVFGAVALMAVSAVGFGLLGGDSERSLIPILGDVEDDQSPAASITLNLMLAVLIPVAGLATWVAHRIRPRYVSSVAGGLRWRWLGRCLLVTLPIWAIYLSLGFLIDPPASGRPAQWVLLLVVALVLTPFQAAGEEYLFRGWLTQNVGVFFARPVVGLVVSATVSAALFSLAHGSFDPWVLAQIATFAVAASYANWRTGGLEAGIAMHVVNNVLLGVATTSVGGYADSFVSETTTSTPTETAVGLLVHAAAVVAILWQARRTQVQRRYQPMAALPGGPPPFEPTRPVARREPATWYAPLGRPPAD